MQEKLILFKEALARTNNLGLFTEEKEGYLGGLINLNDKMHSRVYVSFNLFDNTFYNEIRALITAVDLSKKYRALDLINELNIKYMNTASSYFLLETNNNDISIFRKFIYTASVEEFDPMMLSLILKVILDEIEKHDMKKIMQLAWL